MRRSRNIPHDFVYASSSFLLLLTLHLCILLVMLLLSDLKEGRKGTPVHLLVAVIIVVGCGDISHLENLVCHCFQLELEAGFC